MRSYIESKPDWICHIVLLNATSSFITLSYTILRYHYYHFSYLIKVAFGTFRFFLFIVVIIEVYEVLESKPDWGGRGRGWIIQVHHHDENDDENDGDITDEIPMSSPERTNSLLRALHWTDYSLHISPNTIKMPREKSTLVMSTRTSFRSESVIFDRESISKSRGPSKTKKFLLLFLLDIWSKCK